MVVFINVTSSRAKARDARRVSDMHQIQNALELYNQDCGQYPPTLNVAENTGCSNGGSLGSFLNPIPTNPTPPDIPYNYNYDDANKTYTLTFNLENTVSNLAAGSHTLTPDGIQ